MAAAGIIGGVMSGVSMIVGAYGQAQGMAYEAAKAQRAAEIGRVQADQTDAAYREDFTTTLANIQAIRAATGADPASPTSLAFIEGEREASDRIRTIKVGGLRMGANQADADAGFYRSSARTALLGGVLQGLGAFAGGFA